MATKSTSRNSGTNQRSATIQWIALAIVAALAVLAAFIIFGEDSPSGGHLGAPGTTSFEIV